MALALSVYVCSLDADVVERYYSRGVYPWVAGFLGAGVGWLPFSLGDCLYALAAGWLLVAGWQGFRQMRRIGRGSLPRLFWSGFMAALWVYVFFQLLWGLNYDRPAIDHHLGLDPRASDTALLPALTTSLLMKANAYASAGLRQEQTSRYLYQKARLGYLKARDSFPALQVPHFSFKPSLFGVVGNYIGYSGYFNPFTGEGQLNTHTPSFVHPFVTCHELAHQLGYAREQEANLVGFLAARVSPEASFRYAAYLEMFLYAYRDFYRIDSAAARECYAQSSPAVKRDIQALQDFQRQYRTPFGLATDWLYDHYLRWNGQPEGLRAYGRVVSWLLALYRQEGGWRSGDTAAAFKIDSSTSYSPQAFPPVRCILRSASGCT